jgi:hypothetical protein
MSKKILGHIPKNKIININLLQKGINSKHIQKTWINYIKTFNKRTKNIHLKYIQYYIQIAHNGVKQKQTRTNLRGKKFKLLKKIRKYI